MKKRRSAFSLIEILIVVAIIAVLAGVGFSYYSDYLQDSKEAVIRHNLKTVREAISMYFKQHMAYPTTLEVLTGPHLKDSVAELLLRPLEGVEVYVVVPANNAAPQAFMATLTIEIPYNFDGSNVKEIKNIKIKYSNNIMTW